jgi:hypothetical protein
MIANRLPSNLGAIADQLRSERDAMHERGESTEGHSWRPRIDELLDSDH